MNALAVELNRALEGTVIASLLSGFGKRFYFPRGIVAQSAEAKRHARRLNATVGMATDGAQPLHLGVIGEHISGLQPEEVFSYAPTGGNQALREAWKEEMVAKNPSLAGALTSLPLVTCGLTHGIMLLADLFAEAGDSVVLPDQFWGNYRLVFEGRIGAALKTFPFFAAAGGMNVPALEEAVAGAGPKALVLLNFPNNPTGYSPTEREADLICQALRRRAEAGQRILLITDDAYFGLFYEKDTYRQSLFAGCASLHRNLLAVKADAATKEDLVWGFRLGFLTFAGKGLEEAHLDALVQKVTGAVRASVSNSNQLGQSLLLKAMRDPAYREQKERVFRILEGRYRRTREILGRLQGPLQPLPFNSGYFMTFRFPGGSAEELRRKLLMEQGIGTISIQDRYLRVAYSSVPEERLEELYSAVYQAARAVAG